MALTKTAQEVITRSLRLIRVIGQDESPLLTESDDALIVLNSMLDEWALDPHLTSSSVSLPAFATLSTSQALRSAMYSALYYNLAVRLAPEYGVAVATAIEKQAGALYDLIGRDIANDEIPVADNQVGLLESRRGNFDITTG